jgi:tRNA threonylcarbamoyladenosine modification (KEOPS) complex Cgi121 subunit
LIKQAGGFDQFVGIAGLRDVQVGDVEVVVDHVREELGAVTVQVFDARLVAGWQHLFFAALNALKAFKNGTNISKSLAVECLLYACAQTQIRVALDALGIKASSSEVAVLVVGDEAKIVERSLKKASKLLCGILDEAVLDLTAEKLESIKEFFGISDDELSATSGNAGAQKAVVDLVIEHMALLDTLR